MFFGLTEELMLLLLAISSGVDIKDIRKLKEKNKYKDIQNLELSERIDAVSKKLIESKDIIDSALHEMERQIEMYENIKKEALISQQISSINQEQVTAINDILEKTLNKQDKKTFPKNLLVNAIFCVVSAVLGFLLGKFL